MGLVDRLREGWDTRAAGLDFKTADISALTWSALLGQPMSRSGVPVSISTSLKTTTMLACLRVLAEGVAGADFDVLRVANDGSYTYELNHPVRRLIRKQPNEWMTGYELREMGVIYAALCGNAHWYKNKVGKNQVVRELIPLLPGRCTARQLPDLTVVYDLSMPDGSFKTLPREDIMHLRGPMWNPIIGLDVMMLAREAIGLAIATEESHAMLHANGVQPGGIVTVAQGGLDEKAKERLREAFDKNHRGVQNAFRTVVVDVATKYEQTKMSGVDAQHLETRRFQIEEICRAMRVFPQMVGHTDKTSTFASANAFFVAHVIYSLKPWFRRHCGVYSRDLLGNADDLEPNFSVFDEMYGDLAALAQYFSKALGTGGSVPWMTQDEVRRLVRLNPRRGSADELPIATNPRVAGAGETPDPDGGRDAEAMTRALHAARRLVEELEDHREAA
jgi:HK97 family phage portal protein